MTNTLHHIPHRSKQLPPLRVGIGGPVGSGKTTLLEMLCKATGAWRRADWVHVRQLNDWVLHTRETSELRLQTEQMGRSMPNGCATSTKATKP